MEALSRKYVFSTLSCFLTFPLVSPPRHPCTRPIRTRDIVEILTHLCPRFTLDPSLSLSRVAETLPFTYTGADLYALCSDAMLKAITRAATAVDAKVAAHNARLPPKSQHQPISIAHFFDHYATDEDTDVVVTEEDFAQARRELVPSVSVEELGHYERVRRTFEGQGQTASSAPKSAGRVGEQHNPEQTRQMRIEDTLPTTSANGRPVQPPPSSNGAANGARGASRGRGASREGAAGEWRQHWPVSGVGGRAGSGQSPDSERPSVESRKSSTGSKIKAMLKGKGKGKEKGGRSSPHSSEMLVEGGDVEDAGLGGRRDVVEQGYGMEGEGEDEEDYVIRPNGVGSLEINGGGTEKGKGKGKGKVVDGFGDAAEGDEELYS